jgi:large subunit ribosomal protein L31e
MADTTSELERIYTIPLRHAHHGKRSKRADRAVKDVRTFLTRHMKSDNIWLAGEVNELIWKRGKYTIPSRIRVRATRFSDGVVEVALPESDSAGSIREQIAERQEKAAETPVLAPMGMDDDEDDHHDSELASKPVTEVTGIGPATAEKLGTAEIETVGDLAHAEPKVVAEVLGKDLETVMPWIEAAREMAHGAPADDSEE